MQGSHRHAGSACQSNYRAGGGVWGVRPKRGCLSATQGERVVLRSAGGGRGLPGRWSWPQRTASRGLEDGASAACIPAAGAAAGPPRRPAPEGRPRLRPEQRFLRTPAKQTEAPADVPLIRGPQEGRITDLGVRLVAAGGNTPERN